MGINVKSERLKKLESEYEDLAQWLKLGLVPKKDLEKHKTEMESLEQKILEEKERLKFIKENGENEEYVSPKKNPQQKSGFQEAHTIPDVNFDDNSSDTQSEYESETFSDTDTISDDKASSTMSDITSYDDDDDPFSDRNRWRRGVLEDPDSDDW